MGSLIDFEKEQITAAREVHKNVVRILPLVPGRSESTVRTFIERWLNRGNTENHLGGGRPQVLSERDKRALVRRARKKRRKPLQELRNGVK